MINSMRTGNCISFQIEEQNVLRSIDIRTKVKAPLQLNSVSKQMKRQSTKLFAVSQF